MLVENTNKKQVVMVESKPKLRVKENILNKRKFNFFFFYLLYLQYEAFLGSKAPWRKTQYI